MTNSNDIAPITPINLNYLKAVELGVVRKENFFEDVLTSAIQMFDETNAYQKAADQAQLDFITGKNDNMLDVLLAEQKAYTAVNFTVQVTNKVIEAYREIMRIQL